LKITILGTGTSQGVPVIACKCKVCQSADPRDNRTRTAAMVEVDGKTIVIDAGPDFRQQMLREKVQDIDAILFTHEHKDHIAGLDDIRAFNFINKKVIDVYAEDRVIKSLKREYYYVFSMYKYPGIPQMNLHSIDNQAFEIQGIKIIPIRAIHLELPIFGYRIGNFTYITDANYIADEDIEKMKGSKVIVVNALRKEKHVSHFSLSEAVELAVSLRPQHAYITHMSHQMGLHEDVNSELPRHVSLAYDGLNFEI